MAVRTKRDRALLRRLRSLLNFEGSSFSHVGPPGRFDPLPTSEAEVDAFIERRLFTWRASWVTPILDELEGIGKAYDHTIKEDDK